MIALTPCPKCGKACRAVYPDARGGVWHAIYCKCGQNLPKPVRGTTRPVWRKNPEVAVRAWNRARMPKPDYKALAGKLAEAADEVMKKLEQHGPSIVPHLLDTDENAGERLREVITEAKTAGVLR